MLLEPVWAVGVGGVVGVLVGVAFFRAIRSFVARLTPDRIGRGTIVAGLAWRLALVVLVVGMVAYLGGSAATLAMLVGLVLARVVVPRGPGPV